MKKTAPATKPAEGDEVGHNRASKRQMLRDRLGRAERLFVFGGRRRLRPPFTCVGESKPGDA